MHTRCLQVAIISLLTVFSSVAYTQQKEKVEEGQYALLIKGARVAGSEHTWTLWRTADQGYELEDHFQETADPAAAAIALLAVGRKSRVSPELMKDVEKETVRSGLIVHYDARQRPVNFRVEGKYLTQTKTVDLLKCSSQAAAVKCSSKEEKAELKVKEPREALYSYPFPMLLRPWLAGGLSSESMKVVTVTSGKKLQLERAEISVSDSGPDTLAMGDKQFHAHKYRMEVRPETSSSITLTLWTDAKGTILAAQVPTRPDELIALVQYKNYSVPAPAAPADK